MKQIILIAILFFGINTIYAQEIKTKKQLFPISISLMHESISLPFVTNPIKYQYNPALSISTEFLLKKKRKYDLHLSGNLGYYYHKDWESTLFTEIKFGYRYQIKRFSISPKLGLGYAHIFTPKPIYGFEDGKFQEIKDKGRSAFQSSISIIPSYKLFQKENSAEVYLTYTFTIQYPYSETNGFHQFIGIGYKFYPFKNN
jgi:hypothetical protein